MDLLWHFREMPVCVLDWHECASAIQPKQWKHSHRIYRALLKLGAPAPIARRVAAKRLGWWRNSNRHLKYVLTISYFDKLGVPRLL